MTVPVAIVTGAAGGIGQAICVRLTQSGYHVIGIDLNSPTHHAYESFHRFDLAALVKDEKERQGHQRRIIESLPPKSSLRLLINNAATQRLGNLSELTFADWQASLDVNVTAPFLLCQMLLERLKKGSGSVINIGSIHAHLTKPSFSAYATSKAALEGLTRALSVELGGQVRINSILPAAVDSQMLRAGFDDGQSGFQTLAEHHPTGEIASAEDVAELVCWLAASRLKCINGATIRADGGIGARLHDPR